MKPLALNPFLGLRSSVANPNGKGCDASGNFVRNRVLGALQEGQGYGDKFATVGIPVNDATLGISNLTVEDIASFTVPDHGGKTITAVMATYTKTSMGFAPPITVNTSGIWVRPYWNGAAWIDSWFELTEFYIFEVENFAADVSKIILQQTTPIPSQILTSDYLKDFTVILNGDFTIDHENRLLIKNSTSLGSGATDAYINIATDGTFGTSLMSDWTPSVDKIYVYRSRLNQAMPGSLSSWITNILADLRVSTGPTVNDLTALVGFRTKTLNLAGAFGAVQVIDGLIADIGGLNIPKDVVSSMLGQNNVVGWDIPAAIYILTPTLVMDDGSETALLTDASISLTTSGTNHLKFDLLLLPTVTRRLRYVRVNVSIDGGATYNKLQDVDPYNATGWDGLFWDSVKKNFYASFTIEPTALDLLEATDSTEGNLQRTVTDSGIAHYASAVVSGNQVFATGVYLDSTGTLYPNQVFTSIQNGTGQPQFDVFIVGAFSKISVEYNDGDSVVGIGTVGNAILVLKKRSLVLLTDDGRGGWNRTVVSRGVGCASARSIVSYDNRVYWLDYNGFYAYDGSTLIFSGLPIRDEVAAIINTLKEASVATLDRVAKYYRCAVNGIQYCLDLDGISRGELEWMQDRYSDEPTRFAFDTSDGSTLFLDSTGLKLEKVGGTKLQGGANTTYMYQSTNVDPPPDDDTEYLLQKISAHYVSDIPFTVSIFLNDNTAAEPNPIRFKAGKFRGSLKLALGIRCYTFHVKVTAVTSADGQTIKLKKLGVLFTTEPIGTEVELE